MPPVDLCTKVFLTKSSTNPSVKDSDATALKSFPISYRALPNKVLEPEMTNSSRKKYKYKCLEPLCHSSNRYDRWVDHCKRKHVYKYCNRLEIKHKVVKLKHYDTPWRRWRGEEPLSARYVIVL